MIEEIKVSRECPHCRGSLERYEDPVAVEIISQRDTKIAALEAEVMELRKDRSEFINWLLHQNITPENIGNIRRQCFMPYDCSWNAFVRDETAARENTALNSAKGEK